MASDRTRAIVWDRLLDADRLARYWGMVVARTHRAERVSAATTLLLSSGVVISSFSDFMGQAVALRIASLAIALVSGWTMAHRFSRSESVSQRAMQHWSGELSRLEILFARLERIDDDEALIELALNDATSRDVERESAAAVPEKRRLSRRAWSDTVAARSTPA